VTLKFIRFVYLFGAVLDAVNVFMYLAPGLFLSPLGISVSVTPVLRYVLIHAAVLMLAWTLLLFWGYREPLARRGVLLLTVPISLGMEFSAWYLHIHAGVAIQRVLPMMILPLVVAGLFLSAWLKARLLVPRKGKEHD
jgi:hypothetical protein